MKAIILQYFEKECKYVFKDKKTSKYITDDIESSTDGFDGENSDEESSNEKN